MTTGSRVSEFWADFGDELKDISDLPPKRVMELLRRRLASWESEGGEVNWENLSLYFPESAKALLEGLASDNLALIWNGLATENHETCIAGGVSIMRDGSFVRYYCTASLVSEETVLTARHCVPRLSHATLVPNVDPASGWLPVKSIWEAGKAGGSGVRNDIALLEVRIGSDEVPKGFPRIAPESVFGKARHALIVGYGPEGKSSASAGTRREGLVQPIWETFIPRPRGGHVDFDPDTEFVCGAGPSSQDALPGDSGAPIYLQAEGSTEWMLAGVLSRGAGLRNDLGAGAVYTKILAYLDEMEGEVGPLWRHEGAPGGGAGFGESIAILGEG